jgi:hypothetical protein
MGGRPARPAPPVHRRNPERREADGEVEPLVVVGEAHPLTALATEDEHPVNWLDGGQHVGRAARAEFEERHGRLSLSIAGLVGIRPPEPVQIPNNGGATPLNRGSPRISWEVK